MKPECKDITNVILPAVRASVALSLNKRYSYTQERIAEKLGVVQVAINKYLHGRYSGEIAQMKDYIERKRLGLKIASEITGGGTRIEIDRAIDDLCDKLITADLTHKLANR